jgi:hypothetical protein
MADDLRSTGAVEAPGAAPPAPLTSAPTRSERARKSVYRLRFALVYVVLAAIVGGAVGTFIVLMSRPDAAPAAEWSSWKPEEEASEGAKAKQIADHISTQYRLPSGNQLAVAVVGPPEFSAAESGSIPVSAVAIRPDTSRGQAEESDIDIHPAADTLMIQLCGLGERCSISEGEPSEERHALLRREALELSLYAFKYVDGLDSVLVFLPPRPDAEIGTSVYLRKGDVDNELRRPLASTLSAKTTPALGSIEPKEQAAIDRITRNRLYQYGVTQAQDGSAILILDPVAS